jgi:hypothetical protein
MRAAPGGFAPEHGGKMAKIADLITDCATGQYSHTKIWTNIAYAAATFAFIRLVLSDTPPGLDIWLVYLVTVGAHNAASKFLSMRFGGTK